MRLPIIVIVLLLLGSFKTVQAQYYYQETNKIGVKVGALVSRLNPTNSAGGQEKVRNSVSLGAYATFPIRRKLHIHADVSYSLRGGKVTNPSAIADTIQRNITFRLNYIEATGLVCYAAEPLYAGIGPSVSYLFRAKGKGLEGADTSGTDWQVSKSNFRWYDVGLSGEIGFKSDTYVFGLRGTYGIFSISTSSKAQALLPNARNINGQLFVVAYF
jgi:hypothetical protein